jgi:RNA polymerase sigma factor (sigma-70 family)
VEASALPAPSGLARTRISIGPPLLRLRSDEQLVSLFRDGNHDAFRVIHDRYRQRLFAYTRQMLPGSRQDAEDALQDVFVRAYGGLRTNRGELALRAWLYRIAHNRCIDELRRPAPPAPEVMELVRPPVHDPIAEAEQRESLRRLIADVRRLPEQQRSALLMRELGGMTYTEIAVALAVSVPAIKSLLVRARVGLAQAAEARDASCSHIREELIVSHDRGVRPTGLARRHMRDCPGCREFRGRLRGTSRQFAAMLPALGPAGVIAKILGFGGGGSAAAGGGAVAATGAVGTGGGVVSAGVLATGAGHMVTILAAAAVTAGGAVEIQHQIAPIVHRAHHRSAAVVQAPDPSPETAAPVFAGTQQSSAPAATAATASAADPATVPAAAAPAAGHSRADTTFTAPVKPGASITRPSHGPQAGGSDGAGGTGTGTGDSTGNGKNGSTVAGGTLGAGATGTSTGSGSTSATGDSSSTSSTSTGSDPSTSTPTTGTSGGGTTITPLQTGTGSGGQQPADPTSTGGGGSTSGG